MSGKRLGAYSNLRVLRKSLYVWNNQSEQGRRYELLVTENMDGQDRKYSLTNQKPSTSTQRLSWMQRQRYWVERCFEDGKGQCGMADYQVRLWNAWHHHMALVMMAILFMLTERLHMKDQCPLLSCADIERLLAAFLPRREASPEQVYSHMLLAIHSYQFCRLKSKAVALKLEPGKTERTRATARAF